MKNWINKTSLGIFGLLLLTVFVVQSFLSGGSKAAGVFHNNVFKNLEITMQNGSPLGELKTWENFKIAVDFELPDGQVKGGDISEISLSQNLSFGNNTSFEIKENDELVAIATIDSAAKKLILTYTNYVENHVGVNGNFFFLSRVDHSVAQVQGEYDITIKSGETVLHTGKIKYAGNQAATKYDFTKIGWSGTDGTNILSYRVPINQNNNLEVKNAVITDRVESEYVQILFDDKFRIYEGDWVEELGEMKLKNTKSLKGTDEAEIIPDPDGRGFRITVKEIKKNKGYQIHYNARITYDALDGEVFTNSIKLEGQGITTKEEKRSVRYVSGGGLAEGYKFRIELTKKNEKGDLLQGARFRVVREKNGEIVGEIMSDDDGLAILTGLLRDKYMITELEAPEGYIPNKEAIVLESDAFDSNYTFKHTVVNKVNEKINIPFEIKWNGGEASQAVVKLKVDGAEKGTITLNKGDGKSWKDSFTELYQFNSDGSPIEYIVEQNSIDGYTTEVVRKSASDITQGFIITNTKKKPKIKVEYEIKWVGGEANSATVKLTGGIGGTQTLNKDDGSHWKGSFTDLDSVDAGGTAIVYDVKQDKIEGYSTVHKKNSPTSFTITNTKIIKIPFEIVWVGGEGNSSTVNLVGGNGGSQTLSKGDGNKWKSCFKDLPAGDNSGALIDYTITQNDIPEYETKIERKDPSDITKGFIITNTKRNPKIDVVYNIKWVGGEAGSATVKLIGGVGDSQTLNKGDGKNWKGSFKNLATFDAHGEVIPYDVKQDAISGYKTTYVINNPRNFTIINSKLINIPFEIKWVGGEGNNSTVNLVGGNGGSQTLSKGDGKNWTGSFKNVPVGNDSGTLINYTMTQNDIPGYETKIERKDPSDITKGFVITNTKKNPKIKVIYDIQWVGGEAGSATVKLIGGKGGSQTLSKGDGKNWTGSFDDLATFDSYGVAISYDVKQDKIDGYSTVHKKNSSTSFTIINTKHINIPVEIKWVGGIGDASTIHLMGGKGETKTLTKGDGKNWNEVFNNLPVYNEFEKPITYTIKQDVILGYDTTIVRKSDSDITKGFLVTNTKRNPKINIPFEIQWVGGEADKATVKLKGAAVPAQEFLKNDGKSWKGSFNDLFTFDQITGEVIPYLVEQDAILGYKTVIERKSPIDITQGFIITNIKVINIPFEIKWVGGEADRAVVHLLIGDKVETTKVLTKGDGSNWKGAFGDLALIDKTGTPIAYKITQDSIPNYSTKITRKSDSDITAGYEIVNTKINNNIYIPYYPIDPTPSIPPVKPTEKPKVEEDTKKPETPSKPKEPEVSKEEDDEIIADIEDDDIDVEDDNTPLGGTDVEDEEVNIDDDKVAKGDTLAKTGGLQHHLWKVLSVIGILVVSLLGVELYRRKRKA